MSLVPVFTRGRAREPASRIDALNASYAGKLGTAKAAQDALDAVRELTKRSRVPKIAKMLEGLAITLGKLARDEREPCF